MLAMSSRLLLLLPTPLRPGLRGGTLNTASATSPKPADWYAPPKAGWLAARFIFCTRLLPPWLIAWANWSQVLLLLLLPPASPKAALLKLCRDTGAAAQTDTDSRGTGSGKSVGSVSLEMATVYTVPGAARADKGCNAEALHALLHPSRPTLSLC